MQIPKAIKDARFSAPEVLVEANGTLTKREGSLQLDVPGLTDPFTLSGGPQMDELAGSLDSVGKKIHITGHLQTDRHEFPPRLTVESFQQAQ